MKKRKREEVVHFVLLQWTVWMWVFTFSLRFLRLKVWNHKILPLAGNLLATDYCWGSRSQFSSGMWFWRGYHTPVDGPTPMYLEELYRKDGVKIWPKCILCMHEILNLKRKDKIEVQDQATPIIWSLVRAFWLHSNMAERWNQSLAKLASVWVRAWDTQEPDSLFLFLFWFVFGFLLLLFVLRQIYSLLPRWASALRQTSCLVLPTPPPRPPEPWYYGYTSLCLTLFILVELIYHPTPARPETLWRKKLVPWWRQNSHYLCSLHEGPPLKGYHTFM